MIPLGCSPVLWWSQIARLLEEMDVAELHDRNWNADYHLKLLTFALARENDEKYK